MESMAATAYFPARKRLSAKELVLSNCGAGKDSWESLGPQGDQTSQSQRKSTLNIHWKDWCWSSNTFDHLMQRTDSLEKTLVLGKIENGGKKRVTEDEMVRWHHRLNGHNLSKLWKIVKDREALSAAVPGVAKSWTWLTDWTTATTTNTSQTSPKKLIRVKYFLTNF